MDCRRSEREKRLESRICSAMTWFCGCREITFCRAANTARITRDAKPARVLHVSILEGRERRLPFVVTLGSKMRERRPHFVSGSA